MYIHFSDNALQELEKRLGRSEGYRLKLVYDSEGCGCAVSGVPTLWAEPADQKPGVHPETAADSNSPAHVLFEQRQEVFFEDRLTVDYMPSKLAFALKSTSQIYNGSMKLVERRQYVSQKG